MSEKLIFSKDFFNKYVRGERERVNDLIETRPPNRSIQRELRNIFPDIPPSEFRQAIVNDRWPEIELDVEKLPITVEEVVRITGLSLMTVIWMLRKRDDVQVQLPGLVKGKKYSLGDAGELGLNPKRVSREARYQSRPSGGGPVQKARINEGRVDAFIRREVKMKAQITRKERGTVGDRPVRKDRVINEERSSVVREVVDWFRGQGSRKDWIMGGREDLLSERLGRLERGEQVDFLVWNCIGFQWSQERPGGQPQCDLISNRNESLAVYYRGKIGQVAEQLARLGNAEIVVLVPTNEAFNRGYADLGVYKQDEQTRNNLLEETVEELKEDLQGMELPRGIAVKVERWDKYLQSKGVKGDQMEWSEMGIRKMKQSEQGAKIESEMERSGRERFEQKKLVVSREQVIDLQRVYYGMYVGEGMVLRNLPVVVVNFEEMRVTRLESLGADGDLAVVTPVKPKEMTAFYQWKNELKARRYE